MAPKPPKASKRAKRLLKIPKGSKDIHIRLNASRHKAKLDLNSFKVDGYESKPYLSTDLSVFIVCSRIEH